MCKKYQVPIPVNGYWQKLRFNKPIQREKLPFIANHNDRIELQIRSEGSVINVYASPKAVLTRHILNDPNALN